MVPHWCKNLRTNTCLIYFQVLLRPVCVLQDREIVTDKKSGLTDSTRPRGNICFSGSGALNKDSPLWHPVVAMQALKFLGFLCRMAKLLDLFDLYCNILHFLLNVWVKVDFQLLFSSHSIDCRHKLQHNPGHCRKTCFCNHTLISLITYIMQKMCLLIAFGSADKQETNNFFTYIGMTYFQHKFT